MTRSITILGATGSIGTQTLDLIAMRNDYQVVAITSWQNIDKLDHILSTFPTIKMICVKNSFDKMILEEKYPLLTFYAGKEGLIELINDANSDVYINAISGFAGVIPSFRVLELNKILLLANKETLVVAGKLINELLDEGKGKLIPVDSEHVAIAKCLYGANENDVSKIMITASGGSFFDKTREELSNVSLHDATQNPNWKMGTKITIDSNLMANKAFEIIEAHYLFRAPISKLGAVVNRSSVVHGYVVFNDRVLLQVARPDMHLAIKYALDLGICDTNYGKFSDVEENTLGKYKFEDISFDRFPLMKYADFVIEKGGDAGCVFNACDEEAVYAFMNGRLKYNEIEDVISSVMEKHNYVDNITKDDLEAINDKVLLETRSAINSIRRK